MVLWSIVLSDRNHQTEDDEQSGTSTSRMRTSMINLDSEWARYLNALEWVSPVELDEVIGSYKFGPSRVTLCMTVRFAND